MKKQDDDTRSPIEAELRSVRDVIRAINRMRNVAGMHDPDIVRMLTTAIAMERQASGATVTISVKTRRSWAWEDR